MIKKIVIFSLFTLVLIITKAQEVIRYDSGDDETLASDTTFRPPKYKNGDDDFLRDIELYLSNNRWDAVVSSLGDIVYLEFVVKSDGSIDKLKINNTTNFDLNIPLKQVISSQTWNPRIRSGMAVSTKMYYSLKILPIIEYPYIEVSFGPERIASDPATKQFKIFAVVGLLLIMGTLLLVN